MEEQAPLVARSAEVHERARDHVERSDRVTLAQEGDAGQHHAAEVRDVAAASPSAECAGALVREMSVVSRREEKVQVGRTDQVFFLCAGVRTHTHTAHLAPVSCVQDGNARAYASPPLSARSAQTVQSRELELGPDAARHRGKRLKRLQSRLQRLLCFTCEGRAS